MAIGDKPKARQSQLVTTYGVGSLFPDADASYMIAGIDEWGETRYAQLVEEPRLAKTLGVDTFRAPPTGRKRGDVPAIRFPEWHYCSGCRALAPFWRFGGKRGETRCVKCSRDLTPSRFVACCENGHIEDFPYFQWVHRGQDAVEGADHELSLRTGGNSSSLASIVVSCSCGVKPYDMEGAFGAGALKGIRACSGNKPWLGVQKDVGCDRPLRVFQRGAANVWFPVQRSSISIPPWSSVAAQYVSRNWGPLSALYKNVGEESARFAFEAMTKDVNGVTVDDVLDVVRQRLGLDDEEVPDEAVLRTQEYEALMAGHDGSNRDTFQCTAIEVHSSLDSLVAQVSQVNRLREVRVLSGFSRVTPVESETGSARTAKLSVEKRDWLPAIEVMGEGIFVRLDEDAVAAWETSEFARTRQDTIRQAQAVRDAQMNVVTEPVTARFLALHSLAHLLLKELSLDAGYPQGAIRERVYGLPGQAGILLYTASSDSAGSLGGLAALADAKHFAPVFRNALDRATWCSNDPVCAESGPSGSDALDLAACHACGLAPETSCEHRNQFLDRLTVVGSPQFDAAGLASTVVGRIGQIPPAWLHAIDSADVEPAEREFAKRLVAAASDLPAPTFGIEAEGIIVEMAWEDLKVVVDLAGMSDVDRDLLAAKGWTVLPADLAQVVAALKG